MAIKEIITDVEKFNERAEEIDVRKEGNLMREIILDLKHTVRKNNLVCLAAPQIGYNKRIMCINFNGDLRTFINPVLGNFDGFGLNRESCPTLGGREYIRPRYCSVSIMYQTPLGKIESREFKGVAATVAQYGVDILDGLLLSDVGLELDENWDKATQEERDEIISMYLESLDLKEKEIKKEIDNDPDAKKMMDAINFMESVQKGETKLEAQEILPPEEETK